jgi:hypothetical protein
VVHSVTSERQHRISHRHVMDPALRSWAGALLAVRRDAPENPARILRWTVDELEMRKPGLTAGEWAVRLRCAACGRRPDGVALRVPEVAGRAGRNDRFAALVGRGAPGHGGLVDQVESVTRMTWRRL